MSLYAVFLREKELFIFFFSNDARGVLWNDSNIFDDEHDKKSYIKAKSIPHFCSLKFTLVEDS